MDFFLKLTILNQGIVYLSVCYHSHILDEHCRMFEHLHDLIIFPFYQRDSTFKYLSYTDATLISIMSPQVNSRHHTRIDTPPISLRSHS